MFVLFATGSPANYMLPPRLGEEQVNCGPDWVDDAAPDSRVRSLATPVGEYDLAKVAARLSPQQKPDAVVCLVDASWRNLPRNLGAFKCPRVLLVADTHHLKSPLIGMLRYAAAEPFDRIVFLYDRHHAAFFHAAGFRNIFWFPGLTFPHGDATVHAARSVKREPRIAFVGQAGKFHPYRARLLEALAARKLPVAARQISQAESLGFYGRSLIGFNASLNGDLNLRIFELLAAGAAVLTDRLAPESGLGELFTDGREIVTYPDGAELSERAAHLIARPTEARAIGAAGAKWFDEQFNETRRRDAFRRLVLDGVEAFPLPFAAQPPVFFGGNTDRLLQSLVVYEALQETHRQQESVCVALDPDAPADFARMCATLPRVRTIPTSSSVGADLAVLSRARLDPASTDRAPCLWCWDAGDEDRAGLIRRFSSAGFEAASNDVALFIRNSTAASAATEETAQAKALLLRNLPNEAMAMACRIILRNPQDAEAAVFIGELALRARNSPLAERVLRHALTLHPDDVDIQAPLAEALLLNGRLGEARSAVGAVLNARPSDLRGLITLAHVHLAEGNHPAAETVLRRASEIHPDAQIAALELGDLLKRGGQILEAISWHRRSSGATTEVSLIDPSAGPVRVAFVVQHPQGWTSLQAVWQALAADPAFATTIIAAPYNHPYPPEGGPEAIYGFLKKEGVPFVRWNKFPLAPDFADLVFLQNPYDVTRPEALQTQNLIKLVPRLAYVPYGLEIGGGEVNGQNQFNLPLQRFAWAVFARSPRHKAMFARHCSAGDAHVAVTGHPRLDTLRSLGQMPRDPEFTAHARGRKMVFWNPQFDIRPDGTGYSTFMTWERFFIDEFARRQRLAFVIRPHPLFFGTLEKRNLWNAAQVADFLRRAKNAGNILIDRRASYLPVFAASDAMLSDASTFLLEYSATTKPLLYLHNPRGPQLNDDGEFICRHHYKAETQDDVTAFLDMVEAGRDPRAADRASAYGEVMYCPAGGVSPAIKQEILRRLAVEAHPTGTVRQTAAA